MFVLKLWSGKVKCLFASMVFASLKGCVRYFNRCTTSPMYILYQLNEKMSLESLTISSFTFLEIALASNLHPFHQPRFVYEIYNEKIETSQLLASFQIVTYWNAQTKQGGRAESTVTKLLFIILKNESLKAIICYQHKII